MRHPTNSRNTRHIFRPLVWQLALRLLYFQAGYLWWLFYLLVEVLFAVDLLGQICFFGRAFRLRFVNIYTVKTAFLAVLPLAAAVELDEVSVLVLALLSTIKIIILNNY